MLMSRDELEIIEACIILVLDQKVLPREDERDAKKVLETIRTYLDDLYEKEQADAQDPSEQPGEGDTDAPK
jgi:hypothetical protein